MMNRADANHSDETAVISRIRETIDRHQKFWLTTHIHPDGDGLASMLMVHAFLQKSGKTSLPVVLDELPLKFDFLQSFGEIVTRAEDLPSSLPEVLIVLDSSCFHRLGGLDEKITRNTIVINIDHHASNNAYGDINLIRGEASSAAEVTYDVLKGCGAEFDTGMAVLAYSGIICDTGRFIFPNTSQHALSICAEMVSLGASPSDIAEKIYFRSSQATILGLAKSLTSLDFHYDGQVASMVLPFEFINRHDNIDTEGFVDNLLAIDGTEVEFFMKEREPGCFRVSFRSKNHVDVNDVAQMFGGGGHRRAAGATICGRSDEVKASIVKALGNFFN